MTFIHGHALSAEELERTLSRELTPQRFASLCNAVARLTAGRTLQSVPSFTERVNVKDKGIDAELELSLPGDVPYASPYLGQGVNILQFKQRDVFAQGRAKMGGLVKKCVNELRRRPSLRPWAGSASRALH